MRYVTFSATSSFLFLGCILDRGVKMHECISVLIPIHDKSHDNNIYIAIYDRVSVEDFMHDKY